MLTLPLESGHGIFLVLFAVVLVMPRLARRLRVPELVGVIVGGIIVGPFGLGIIERAGVVETLGTAGLLYLMFQAGLDLDPDDFAAQRGRALVFGALTFAAPLTIGTVAHLAFGFPFLAAILLGSCWASHTLLSYPMFRRADRAADPAVAVAVGGTVVTDTAALLVLVGVARAHEGGLTVGYVAWRLPLLALATTAIVVLGPRLATWFFTGIGRDRSVRFLFVMVVLYGSSMLAELVGVEPIIGAFLAGLALNRLVVEGSSLSHEVEQWGSTLLVPVFLVSVGMLVDPVAAFSHSRTLAMAAVFTAAVTSGKALAALVAARLFGYRPGQAIALFALSVPQAAATLAAVFVGARIGLIESDVLDAVVIVILFTCLLGSAAASQAIHLMPPTVPRATPLGRRILVPVLDPAADATVVRLAAALARPASGTVHPLAVLDLEASPEEVRSLRTRLTATLEDALLAEGAEARAIVRLDLTPTAGIAHAAIEHEVTCILLSWNGRARGDAHTRFDPDVDTVLDLAAVPVLVVRPGIDGPPRRLVVAAGADEATRALAAGLGASLGLAVEDGELGTGAAPPRSLVVAGIDQTVTHLPSSTSWLGVSTPAAARGAILR